MFEALIDGQDDHLAGAAKTALHQHPRQIGLHAGRFAFVVGEDFLDDTAGFHLGVPRIMTLGAIRQGQGRLQFC
jgi:hypothetical protein